MKKSALVLLLAIAGCNENRLAAGNGAPHGPGNGGDPAGAVKPVAVVLAGGGGGGASIFDGTSSYDPDDASTGAIVAFTWALDAVPPGSNAAISANGSGALLAADVAGNYTVSLVVTDRDGLHSDKVSYTLAWLEIEIDGDCLTASCPSEAPYPVGCDIDMDGGDERGCVASTPTSSVVYFQEGDACGAGHVSGTLLCAAQPGLALSATSCPMNKSVTFYPTQSQDCPDTN